MNPIESSDIFRMKRSLFARLIILRNAKWAIFLFSLLTLSGIVCGIVYDIRFFIISLMIIFIVMPGAYAMLYYYHGLKKGCYINVIDHSVECVDKGVIVRVYDDETEIRRETIPYGSFKGYTVGNDYVVFKTTGEWEGFFWLPVSAFANPDVFSQVVRRISYKK